jgi:ribonuclease HII
MAELYLAEIVGVPMLLAGVDDAGRGSAIGPLVIAGVLMREEEMPRLVALGVKDSKLLSARRREVLAPQIKQIAKDYSVVKLTPAQIDDVVLNRRKLRRLNWLEAQAMAEVIAALRPDKAYVDASDVLEDRFKAHILECLPFRIPIVSEHKADRTYPIVSAASIIAKVERDAEIADLARVYGDFGSGYPSDPRTAGFLRRCLARTGEYPEFVRKSWKPVKRVKSDEEFRQTRLI